jgi:hypothetical protein
MKIEFEKFVKKDFQEWSGGFPPELAAQIRVYLDYAMSNDLDPSKVELLLSDWMMEPEGVDAEMPAYS